MPRRWIAPRKLTEPQGPADTVGPPARTTKGSPPKLPRSWQAFFFFVNDEKRWDVQENFLSINTLCRGQTLPSNYETVLFFACLASPDQVGVTLVGSGRDHSADLPQSATVFGKLHRFNLG